MALRSPEDARSPLPLSEPHPQAPFPTSSLPFAMLRRSPLRVVELLRLAAVLLWLSAGSVGALWLKLPPSGTKCVSEDLHGNTVVLADYAVVFEEHVHEQPQPTLSAKVTSPFGNTLHHQENVTSGHFAFTATETGTYMACFWLNIHGKNVGANVNLEWRTGIAAKDWDAVAKKEKIEGVELELEKLETAVEAIHENLLYLREREAQMREVSETTNSRVAWYSLMALGICIVVSVLQLWHLKSYFQKKKLI